MYLKVLVSLLAVVASAQTNPSVVSNLVTYHGVFKEAINGLTYNAFLGIPYAESPIGELRFRPPVHIVLEEGDYYATEFKPFCVQVNPIGVKHGLGNGEEDCLYLNIYTPESVGEKNNLKKVLVYIHGGGNLNGMSDIYIPGRLVTERDIIVVTINYRLGFLGFLSTLTPELEGNFGLKDQLLAISWVKENIASFGGDSGDITIGGESAGAIDVSYLNLVPQSRGLFSRSISWSGMSGVAHPLTMVDPVGTFVEVSRQFGCIRDGDSNPGSGTEIAHIVECLRGIPASSFGMETISKIPDIGPVVYGDLFPASLVELFNDKDYLDAINFFDRDYLISICFNEGVIFNIVLDELLSRMPEEQRKAMPPNAMMFGMFSRFLADKFGPVSNHVVTKVVDYYNNNYEVNPLADFTADAIFHISMLEWATAATKGLSIEDSKAHMLRFVHWPKYMAGPFKGLVHGLDLLYVFDLDPNFINKIIDLQINGSLWDDTDEYLKNKYLSLVSDFIYTGNPALSLQEDLPFGWPAFDEREGHYLEFGLTPQVKTQLKAERMKLWTEQIPEWIQEYPLEESVHTEL